MERLFKDAQVNTALLAEPRGMFKNLSPDMSYTKDLKPRVRTNTTAGKEIEINGITVRQPVNLSKQAWKIA